MKRQRILQKTLLKLAELDKSVINDFIIGLKKIYKDNRKTPLEDDSFPKEILQYVGDFMDNNSLTQKDKLLILAEAKKNKLFGDVILNNSLNKNLERAWRTVLKNWGLSNYNLSSSF